MRQGDQVYYLHGDHLGSTSLTTDENGTPVSEVRYLPYGEERWSDGATPTDFGFTSQRNESSFGLMDYNARYYSPGLGRFVSPDTMGIRNIDPQSFNRYSYVRNNPISRTDASGHCDWCKQLWEDIQIWWSMANPFGGSIYGPAPVTVPTPPPTPNPAEMVGPLLVDDSEAKSLRQINETMEQAEKLAPLVKRLADLSIDPQTGQPNSKSEAEAQSILQAESEGLVKNPRRPDLNAGEPNLDFVIDGGYADIKTPILPKYQSIAEQAGNIAHKSNQYDSGVTVIIDLKNLEDSDKNLFVDEFIQKANNTKNTHFLNR